MWQKILSRGTPAACRELAQSSMNSLTMLARSRFMSLGGLLSLKPRWDRREIPAAAGSEFLADLGLRSGNDARKQVLLPLRFQNGQLPLDFRADQSRTVFHRGHDGGAVVTHLRRKLRRLDTPIQAPGRVGDLLPVRGLDVVGIGQKILPLAPTHRIVNMKAHGHVVFPSDRKRIANELPRFLVGHVETERTNGKTQFVPGIARRSDGLDHIAGKVRHLRLAERKMAGQWLNARIPRHARPDLKEQILGFRASATFGSVAEPLLQPVAIRTSRRIRS